MAANARLRRRLVGLALLITPSPEDVYAADFTKTGAPLANVLSKSCLMFQITFEQFRIPYRELQKLQRPSSSACHGLIPCLAGVVWEERDFPPAKSDGAPESRESARQ